MEGLQDFRQVARGAVGVFRVEGVFFSRLPCLRDYHRVYAPTLASGVWAGDQRFLLYCSLV
eukprot:scaffold9897_cov174-Ochromonas_danica.AAC.1